MSGVRADRTPLRREKSLDGACNLPRFRAFVLNHVRPFIFVIGREIMAKGQAKSEMPASLSKSAGQSKSKSAGKGGPNALDLLTEDHKKVQQLFKAFEKLKEEDDVDDEKAEIVKQACQELTVHAEIEEDIFYPAARDALDEDGDDLLDEAEVEHATAKDLIEQLEEMEPGDELYDAKFTVLGEYINHHIKEEQDELFPKLRKANLNLEELGGELADRKQELMAELQGDEEEEEEEEDEEDDDEDNVAEDEDEDDRRR
jgi:hemerythrin-like domain-containing protein